MNTKATADPKPPETFEDVKKLVKETCQEDQALNLILSRKLNWSVVLLLMLMFVSYMYLYVLNQDDYPGATDFVHRAVSCLASHVYDADRAL